jgi:beta-N-acetylhexosaminidase
VVDTGYGAAIGSRSYGEDPELVAKLGAAAVKGFQDAGVVASAKHFPNHGVAETDSHTGLPAVAHDLETIDSYDLPPFRAAIQAGVPMVMVGHLVYPAIDPDLPASLSPKAIGMLREDLGFDGVVVSDDLAMAGASGPGPPSEAAVASIKAGADLLLISSPAQEQADAYEAVVEAVESGEIPRKSIEESFRRIENVKNRYPLYGK